MIAFIPRQDPCMSIDDVQLEASRLMIRAAQGLAPEAMPMLKGGDGTAEFTVALSGDRVAIGINVNGVSVTLPEISSQAAHELSVMVARIMAHREARLEARWVAAGITSERARSAVQAADAANFERLAMMGPAS